MTEQGQTETLRAPAQDTGAEPAATRRHRASSRGRLYDWFLGLLRRLQSGGPDGSRADHGAGDARAMDLRRL
jgi:hypothetical protein